MKDKVMAKLAIGIFAANLCTFIAQIAIWVWLLLRGR